MKKPRNVSRIPPADALERLSTNYSIDADGTLLRNGIPAPVHCHPKGYLEHSLRLPGNRKCYKLQVQHIVFFLHYGRWPEIQLDHSDKNKLNNYPDNLQEVTNRANCCNKRRHSPDGIGVKPKENGRFAAYACINGRTRYLGNFITPRQAADCAALARALADKGFFG